MDVKNTESTASKPVAEAMEKARNRAQSKIDAMTESSSMLGDVIPDETDTRTTEEKILSSGWEKAVGGSELPTKVDSEIEEPIEEEKEEKPEASDSPEEIKKEKDPVLEKAKTEWREKRDEANKLEDDYRQKYEAYIKEQSKGWGMIATLPRRAFGIQPKLPWELTSLKIRTDNSRYSFNVAAKELLTMKGNNLSERLNRRLLPKIASTLPLVHQRRLEAQKQGLSQAWSESKYIRPTLETISKNKGTLTAVSLGIAAMTPVGVIPVLAAIGAGLVAGKGTLEIGNAIFVAPSRKKLEQARATVGDNFFEKSYKEMDYAMEDMTFHVEAQEARIKTAAVSAGIAAGIGAAGYVSGLGAESVNNLSDTLPPEAPETTNGGFVERVTPDLLDTSVSSGTDNSLSPDGVVESSPETEATPEVASEPDSIEEPNNRAGSDTSGTRVERAPEPTIGRADSAASELPRSGGNGLDRIDTTPEVTADSNTAEPLIKDKSVPEVPRDYSLPPFSSVDSLPSQGIVESVPQAPAVPENLNLTPLTESEATAAFGPTTGPSVEGLTTPEQVVHTVEKGENVWNIMEGKGPDANPVGGKSEVLQGMSPADRGAALDKLVEYYENHPDEAIEVGAVKSEGNIHHVYPGEEINVSILDDKLRELLGINETTPEVIAPAETAVEVPAEAETETVPNSEATPKPDINNMSVRDILAMQPGVESGDPQILGQLNEMGFDKDSYDALNEAISGNIRNGESYDMTLPLTEWMNQYGQTAAPETAPVQPQPEASPILDRVSYTPDDSVVGAREATPAVMGSSEALAAVNSYVAGIEKATGGVFDSLFGLGQPSVSGTFDRIRGLGLNDMVSIAQSGQLPEGVTQVGWDRWVDHINDSIARAPINGGETIGQYITRLASARTA